MSDASGQATLRNAILDFQDAVIEQAELNRVKKFSITGPAIPCGGDPLQYPYLSQAFPYPATENWQKAIGAHVIWLSGIVEITSNPMLTPPEVYRATMDLHAEDRYNFNPGNVDIATQIPDDDNGIFETTGLGQQYDSFGFLRRKLEWRGTELGVRLSARPHTTRLRQPTENVRLRDRI